MNKKMIIYRLFVLLVLASLVLTACNLGKSAPILPDGNINPTLCVKEGHEVSLTLQIIPQVGKTAISMTASCTVNVMPGGDAYQYIAERLRFYVYRVGSGVADEVKLTWSNGVAQAELPYEYILIEGIEFYWSDLGNMNIIQYDGGFNITWDG